jgi:FkbM family methyltransferase
MNKYYNVIKNKTNIIVKNILEIGSRDGDDANHLKNLFQVPNENVWVVEPNPIKFSEIKIKYPNFNLFEYAIGELEGEHDFFQVIGDNISSGTSSLIDRNDDWYILNKAEKIKVNVINGKTLLHLIGTEIDVCKIDVEGLTYEVLNGFDNNLEMIKSIHIECEHKEVWKNQKLYNDVREYLISKNFVELSFDYTSSYQLQSDSIWVLNKYVK